MEVQLQSPSTPATSPTTPQFREAPTKRVVAHLPKEGGDVTIPGTRAGRPDRPGQATQTKTQSMAREATRQKQYDESMFSARLAEALR
jgi:hypothetical protein